MKRRGGRREEGGGEMKRRGGGKPRGGTIIEPRVVMERRMILVTLRVLKRYWMKPHSAAS